MFRAVATLALVLGILACNGDDGPTSPTSPTCVNVAGNWTGTFANNCGGAASGPVSIAQAGCTVNFSSQAIVGEGTMNGSSITFTGRDGCSTDIRGTATAQSSSFISGTFTGTSSGIGFCCPRGNFAGSLTLTR